MPVQQVIETGEGDEKGRAFRAVMLASVEADALHEGGQAADAYLHRPVFAVWAASDGAAGPFAANLRCGRCAEKDTGKTYRSRSDKAEKWQCLRSGGYYWPRLQPVGNGALIKTWIPPLFVQDPGWVDPDGVAFCVLPTKTWVASRGPSDTEVTDALRHLGKVGVCDLDVVTADELAHLTRISPLFAASLSMRSTCPIPLALPFFGQLLIACLDKGLATMAEKGRGYGSSRPWGRNLFGYRETTVEDVGALPGLCMKAKHDELEALLAEQITAYYKVAPKGPKPAKVVR